MMIDFKISFPLISYILKTEYDEKSLNEGIYRVKTIYESNNEQIISIIEKLTGLKYYKKKMAIWIINGLYETSPSPNLLNIINDETKILFDLIYLLVHELYKENNYYNKFLENNRIDETKLESSIYYVCLEVIKEIINDKEFKMFYEKERSDKFKLYLWEEVDKLRS